MTRGTRVRQGDPQRQAPPGTEAPRRRPRVRYELAGCAWNGHVLVGTDAARVTPEDALLVREPGDGLRWHRCLRCDAWVPLPPPAHPTRERVPDRDEVTLPLRGRPLRSRYILRLIAVDRLLHFVVLGALAAGVFAVLAHRAALQQAVDQLTSGAQPVAGGELVTELRRVLAETPTTLALIGAVVAGVALVELAEAVGLWRGRRWAEYLTFVVTTALLAPEVYELTREVSPGKIVTLVINLAVVVYLLLAKRLFGLRGGARAEAAERDEDVSWAALERRLPGPAAAR